jgi:hypothetical protein
VHRYKRHAVRKNVAERCGVPGGAPRRTRQGLDSRLPQRLAETTSTGAQPSTDIDKQAPASAFVLLLAGNMHHKRQLWGGWRGSAGARRCETAASDQDGEG